MGVYEPALGVEPVAEGDDAPNSGYDEAGWAAVRVCSFPQCGRPPSAVITDSTAEKYAS